MKAIILEVRDGYAAVLREDGLIVKTKQLGEIGTTIELSEKVVQFPSRGRRMMRTAVAAALTLAVTGGAYTYTNVAEASYVTLDTEETSVELAVNRMGRVVKVRALDEDSAELARELAADVRRMKVEDAVDAAMTRLGGASTVVAGVTGENEKRSADLQEAVERGAERRERGDMELVTLEISRDERRAAGERDMSAGRWAFERDGGRWQERAEAERTDTPEAEKTEEPDDFDEPERDDRPAFAPEQGAELPQNDAQPPRNDESGEATQRPERWENRNDSEPDGREDWDDDDRDDDDRPKQPENGNRPQPPQQNAQPTENAQPPQGDMTQPMEGAQPPQDSGSQPPQDSGVQPPQSGEMQPPGNSDMQPPMDGGQPRGDGPMALGPHGDMQPAPQGGMPGGGGARR